MVTRATARIACAALVVALALEPARAGAAHGVRNGPWLLSPRADAITLMLERDAPGPLVARVWPLESPERVRVVTDSASTTLHEMSLDGLAPRTRYGYDVGGTDGIERTGGTFTTAPSGSDPTPFRFVIYGDTRTDSATHARVIREVHDEGASFVLHTGDLVSDGRSADSWQRFFAIEREVLRDTPLVPVIGNHEIMRPGSSGIAAFRRYVPTLPGSTAPDVDYVFAYGAVRFVVLNAFEDWTSSTRRAWIESTLTRARAEVPDGFVIVAMHWGLCSCGWHGENRAARAAGLDEIFRRHRVDLVLSGHDHVYERGDDAGLRYLMSGGGGAPLYRRVRMRRYARAFASEHHFVRADVETGAIVFSAIRMDGTVLDTCTLRRSGWDCPPSPIQPRLTAADIFLPSCNCRVAGRSADTGGRTGRAPLLILFFAATMARRRCGRSGILRPP